MNIPVIDLEATGRNIVRLREERGITVRELQDIFGFAHPQTIYKWQWGRCLPSVDSLVILSCVFGVSIERIIVVDGREELPPVGFEWSNIA